MRDMQWHASSGRVVLAARVCFELICLNIFAMGFGEVQHVELDLLHQMGVVLLLCGIPCSQTHKAWSGACHAHIRNGFRFIVAELVLYSLTFPSCTSSLAACPLNFEMRIDLAPFANIALHTICPQVSRSSWEVGASSPTAL